MIQAMHSHYTEQRAGAKIRVEKREGQADLIVGYAAVFYNPSDEGTVYRMFDWLEERIKPGAFDRALREGHDARALFNHDPSNLLGRVGASTCRLAVDDIGLRYEIDAPDTQAGRDAVTSIQRGDVPGSSFAFRATKAVWIDEVRDGQEITIREIEDLDLGDVGPVTYPAYQATTADTRSAGANEQELRAEYLKARTNPAAVNICQRLAEIDLHQMSLQD